MKRQWWSAWQWRDLLPLLFSITVLVAFLLGLALGLAKVLTSIHIGP
jgi:hypothetical protein